MTDQNKDRSSCSLIVALVLVAAGGYGAWRIFSRSDAFEKPVEPGVGAVLILGVGVLAVLAALLISGRSIKSTAVPPEAVAAHRDATDWRKKPDFDTEDARENIKNGLIAGLASLIWFVYFGVTVGDAIRHAKVWWILLGLISLPILVLQAVVSVPMACGGVVVLVGKRRWLRRAACAQGTVVGKSADYIEDSYYEGHWNYDLVLRIDADASVAEFEDQWVGARVSKRIYGRYEFGDRMRVYYSVQHPLWFLIKGE